jgi:ketosteroid isomerase-like protein
MNPIFTSAEDAEKAFYEAIGRGDVDALMSAWADDEEIVCIHPTGQRLTGSAAIHDSWQTIFANNPRFTVHTKSKVKWESVLLAVHSVVETLYLGDEMTPHGPMLTTNVFLRGANGWRLLSHHSSAAASASEGVEDAGAGQESRVRTLH